MARLPSAACKMWPIWRHRWMVGIGEFPFPAKWAWSSQAVNVKFIIIVQRQSHSVAYLNTLHLKLDCAADKYLA